MNLIRKRKCRLKYFIILTLIHFHLLSPIVWDPVRIRPTYELHDVELLWKERENSNNANKNCTFIDNSEFHYIINCVSRYVWISLLENLLQWVISKNKNIHLYGISIITLRNLIKYNFIYRLKKKSYIWR